MTRTILMCLLWLLPWTLLQGTAPAHAQSDSHDPQATRLYLDCNFCDDDHIRREIDFVHHVRDRKQADVHVLVTRQRTGSNGWLHTLQFIGLNRHEDKADTLVYVASESDSEDTTRDGLTQKLALGLVRYVAGAPNAKHLNLSYDPPTTEEPLAAAEDPWDHWWFSLGGNGWFSGEKSYESLSTSANVSAQRVTEELKYEFYAWANYYEQNYEFDDSTIQSSSRSRGANTSTYFSLSDHWSTGGSVSVSASDYSNRDLRLLVLPGLEYNVFPYSKSTTHLLRITYEVGMSRVDYQEETIYNKADETLWFESLRTTLDVIRPWGSISSTLSGFHYLHDSSKHSLRARSSLSLRLFSGFSLDLSGSYARVRDQLSLRKGDASEEEVLLRRRELQTDYTYGFSVGVSYSFGSSYNNIVNPRFGN